MKSLLHWCLLIASIALLISSCTETDQTVFTNADATYNSINTTTANTTTTEDSTATGNTTTDTKAPIIAEDTAVTTPMMG